MAHTPGPWTADIMPRIGNHAGSFSIEVDGMVICGRAGVPSRASESAANARLIAAAPKLLAELKKAAAIIHAEWCFSDDNHGRACDEAHAAIAKAESR